MLKDQVFLPKFSASAHTSWHREQQNSFCCLPWPFPLHPFLRTIRLKQQYCFCPQKLPASKTCLCPGPFMWLWRWLEEIWQWCSEEKEGGNGWRGYFVGYSCWGSVPIQDSSWEWQWRGRFWPLCLLVDKRIFTIPPFSHQQSHITTPFQSQSWRVFLFLTLETSHCSTSKSYLMG